MDAGAGTQAMITALYHRCTIRLPFVFDPQPRFFVPIFFPGRKKHIQLALTQTHTVTKAFKFPVYIYP